MAFKSGEEARAAALKRHAEEKTEKKNRSQAAKAVIAKLDSGDAALADAAVEREAVRQEVPADSRELLSRLPAQVADAAEKARAAGMDEDRIAKLEKLVQGLFGVVENLSKQRASNSDTTLAGTVKDVRGVKNLMRCPVCFQVTKVCGGDHVRIRVMPRDPIIAARFSGVFLNGAHYYGLAIVARAQKDVVENLVAQFEAGERMLTYNAGQTFDLAQVIRTTGGGTGISIVSEYSRH